LASYPRYAKNRPLAARNGPLRTTIRIFTARVLFVKKIRFLLRKYSQ
jgi:hypothetical protein